MFSGIVQGTGKISKIISKKNHITLEISAPKNFNKNLNDKYFSIIELCPISMSILQLSRDGHIRASFNKINNEWKGTYVVP